MYRFYNKATKTSPFLNQGLKHHINNHISKQRGRSSGVYHRFGIFLQRDRSSGADKLKGKTPINILPLRTDF